MGEGAWRLGGGENTNREGVPCPFFVKMLSTCARVQGVRVPGHVCRIQSSNVLMHLHCCGKRLPVVRVKMGSAVSAPKRPLLGGVSVSRLSLGAQTRDCATRHMATATASPHAPARASPQCRVSRRSSASSAPGSSPQSTREYIFINASTRKPTRDTSNAVALPVCDWAIINASQIVPTT